MVTEYAYDPEGFRVVKKAKGETIHYVFQGMEPIFEKNITTGKVKSYVYAFGKHLARVDGRIGDTGAKKYWYVTDHLGSVRVVTDKDGKKVWSADYLAFGKQYTKDGDFEELHSFTGKEYDPDIGLYYFNARWYDPDLGRFISEDPVADSNNPNLYSYCGNNPVMRVDPTGKIWWWVFPLLSGLDAYLCGGDFMQGFVMGAFTGALGGTVGSVLQNTAWGAALAKYSGIGFSAMSGAIGGGITGELFGEGFGKGAVYGAVGGVISYGVDTRFGEYASKSTFNKLIINGLKGGLNGLARGGDFIEGFGYGFAYGLVDFSDSSEVESGEPNGSGEFTPILDELYELSGEKDPWYYYNQKDPEWAGELYTILDPSHSLYPQTIGSSGCGPTCAAMAISKLTGVRVTPLMTARFALNPDPLNPKRTYRTIDDGTSGAFFAAIGKEYGLNVIETSNFYEAKRYLNSNPNSIVVALMGTGHFTRGRGHYIVLDSTRSFTTRVLDPNRASNNRYWWDLILAFEGKQRYYIFTNP